MGLEMIKPLEFELKTYDRERTRLEDEHRGKFVLIRGKEIVAVFGDFRTASEHAARWLKQQSYLIHGIGIEMTGTCPRLRERWPA